MAGKLKLPLRNVSQVNTVLAPLAGTGNVSTAMKELGNDTFTTNLYKELYDKGIIKPRSGLSYEHGAIMNRVKNWNQYGMNNFYNSDDYTRMVSSLSARNVFRNGRALLEEGGIDLKGFLKMCQTDYLSETDKINFVSLVGDGKLQTAETFMERRWTEMTMFEYEQINRPEKLNSGVGKILGQFSTYPLSLAQFMRRGLEAEGGWFATKMLMATTSTAFFYGEILGMDSVINANPIENIMFTGGPIPALGAQTMINVKNLTFNPSLGGVKAIGRDFAKTFVPFSGIGNRLADGVAAFNEGDFHAGVVNTLGAAVNEDAFIRNF